MLLETTYKVRNTISSKNNQNTVVPRIEYLHAIHKIFKDLSMDLSMYDNNYRIANTALARTAFKIVYDDGMMNGEISIIELTDKLYDRYCKGYNKNSATTCSDFSKDNQSKNN